MKIKPEELYKLLYKYGVEFYTGVPDSTIKDFCFFLDSNLPKSKHIIAANEGNSIGIATGYHLSTGKIPLVYMQNSGLGNSVNPLLSLCEADVYSIPTLGHYIATVTKISYLSNIYLCFFIKTDRLVLILAY